MPAPKRNELPGRMLDAVLTFGGVPLQQSDLAGLADVSPSMISARVQTDRNPGALLTRSPVRFSPAMGLVLAVSVGAETIRVGLVDANGEVWCEEVSDAARSQLAASKRKLLNRVRLLSARVLDRALREEELSRYGHGLPVIGAAMALPTPINRRHQQIGRALSHPTWQPEDPDDSLNSSFADALGPPFNKLHAQVMNDCNAAAVAFAFDRVRLLEPPRTSSDEPKRERSTSIVVRVSAGIGMGTIEVAADSPDVLVSRFLKSRVTFGTNGLAGEIGHLAISLSAVERLNSRAERDYGSDLEPMDHDAMCACGVRRHLQAIIGTAAIAQRLRLPADAKTPMRNQLEKYLHPATSVSHPLAAQALTDAGKLLGRALSGPVLALDPGTITVIGALSQRSLIGGLLSVQDEWGGSLTSGSPVSLVAPPGAPEQVILRGAGLALVRARRHRWLREIATGRTPPMYPVLRVAHDFIQALRDRAWVSSESRSLRL